MCRENEGVEQDKYFFQGSTPHVRGNPEELTNGGGLNGLNPTCAGKPLPDKA